MKFKYPKRKKSFNLILGLIWVTFGVFMIWGDIVRYFEFVWIGLGLFYMGMALYMQVVNYVSIEKEQIVKHNLVPIKIPFSKITNIKETADRFIVQTAKKKIKIYKNNIQKKQRPILEEALEKIKQEFIPSGSKSN